MALKERIKRWLPLIQILVSVLLVWIVFRQIPCRDVSLALQRFGWAATFWVLVTSLLKLGLSYINWEIALRLNPGFHAPRRQIWHSFWAGQPLSIALPGGPASFGKAYLVDNTSKIATALSVLFEKFYQGWVTWVSAAIAACVYFTRFPFGWRISAVVIIALVPWIVPQILRRSKLHREVRRNYLRLCPVVLVLQSVQFVITVWQYWILLSQVNPVAFSDTLVAVPLILFSGVIPITIGGLGLREMFAENVLRNFGFAAGAAVSASLTVFFLNTALPALLGIYSIFAARRQRTSGSSESSV
jgi:uncharacterized membrane protein YbhN (UPF0104 family)